MEAIALREGGSDLTESHDPRASFARICMRAPVKAEDKGCVELEKYLYSFEGKALERGKLRRSRSVSYSVSSSYVRDLC